MASTKLCFVFLLMAVSCALAGYQANYQNQNQLSYGNDNNGWNNHQDYYAKPSYKYSYGVNDHHTKDQKHASEHRDGDNVQGQYSLREADGSWRHVSYVADKGGFRANVHRTGGQQGWDNNNNNNNNGGNF